MKKIFEAKSIFEALENASKELNIPLNEILYIIKNDKLDDQHVIEVYSLEDVCDFGKEYLQNAINNLNIKVEINCHLDNHDIYINVDSDRKPILIGKNGKTLKAFDELINLAISSHFKRKFNVFFDIGGYKSKKFSKITNLVKQAAIEVIEKHNEIKIGISNDLEKKVIFQVLKKFHDIHFEIIGFDNNRSVLIKYKFNKTNKKIDNREEEFNNVNDMKNNLLYTSNSNCSFLKKEDELENKKDNL